MEKTNTENTKTTTTPTEDVKQQDPAKLLEALYYMLDAFDRANMRFFLVGDTARSAIANKDLTGSHIEIGVRANEWRSGAKRILDDFAPPVKETDGGALYEYGGVPIMLITYPDSPEVMAPDMVRYRYEEFYVPNPFSSFEEMYG